MLLNMYLQITNMAYDIYMTRDILKGYRTCIPRYKTCKHTSPRRKCMDTCQSITREVKGRLYITQITIINSNTHEKEFS